MPQKNWQYLFVSSQVSADHCTWKRGRHHIHERSVQSAVKKAIKMAGRLPENSARGQD